MRNLHGSRSTQKDKPDTNFHPDPSYFGFSRTIFKVVLKIHLRSHNCNQQGHNGKQQSSAHGFRTTTGVNKQPENATA
jgi:hypothetical protein